MQLGCTKKLQEFLKKDIAPVDEQLDSFYSWSASLMSVKRRKTMVVVHDASRCGFVLHGLTAKELKELDRLILEGIRGLLMENGIDAAVADRYIQECGKITYTKTKDRKVVARLNSLCERMEYFKHAFMPENCFQKHLLNPLNRDIVKMENGYDDPRKALQQEFVQRYADQQVIVRKMAVLDVKLLETSCFRRICMPMNRSLSTLHQAIQIAFGWQDSHLHEFESADGLPLDVDYPDYGFLAQEDEWGEDSETAEIERFLSLEEAFAQVGSIRYIYDLGDYWVHEITLADRKINHEDTPVHCVLATGATPPEDVGGVSGYEEMLRILKDPEHEEYEEYQCWLEDSGWGEPDLEQINKCLRWLS